MQMLDPSNRTKPPTYLFRYQSCQRAARQKLTASPKSLGANRSPHLQSVSASRPEGRPPPKASFASVSRYLRITTNIRKRKNHKRIEFFGLEVSGLPAGGEGSVGSARPGTAATRRQRAFFCGAREDSHPAYRARRPLPSRSRTFFAELGDFHLRRR